MNHSRQLIEFDACPHCGDGDEYCKPCGEATRHPDHCSRCALAGRGITGENAWLPINVLPHKAGATAYYRCDKGHPWSCWWGAA